jgi:hypothetical protein
MTKLRLQISAPDHLQKTVDVWIAALRLLPSDPRALAALMKSDTPLPNSIRYLIGELFSPGRPPLLDVQAVPKKTGAHTMALEKLGASLEYYQRTGAGQSSEDAVEELADGLGVSSRQIYRWLAEDMPEQFKTRLVKFTDKINSGNVSDEPARITNHSANESANDLIQGVMSMTG